jgi:hypothetical protein
MKKLLFILLALLLIVGLTGCNIVSKHNKNTTVSADGNKYITINGFPAINDWDSWVKAFNMLPNGGTLNINAGTYTISTPVISLSKNILIEGDDIQNPTIIKCVAMAFMVGNDNWIFRNLTIETAESYGVGISTLNSKNVFLQNVIINGTLYNGDYHVGDLN